MSKLNVPGVDPARIECEESDGRQSVRIVNGGLVASLGPTGISFSSSHDNACCKAMMNAAIDHWRATGRLFPEPEPVACVCGDDASVSRATGNVWCRSPNCGLSTNTVAEWNIAMAALKAAKNS